MKKPLEQKISDNNSIVRTPFQRLVMHSAVAAALLGGGYGRGAYAGSCTPGPVSVCSGPANDGVDVTQDLSGTSLTVTTSAGFGIDTTSTGGNGLQLSGTDGLSFTDANTSLINGSYKGIYALNSGDGALSITSTGDVTGIYDGIVATNYGTALTLQTATVTTFYRDAINARNRGSGALSITSSGAVTGTRGGGIYAYNRGTSLTLQTAAVTGGDNNGIHADNYGSGPLSITSSGVVKGRWLAINVRNRGDSALSIVSKEAVTGSHWGISASNWGTNLTLKTAAVTGEYFGIDAYNLGSGALSITSSGVVTGGSKAGISAKNYGTDLTVQTLEVTGGAQGIFAQNQGSGELRITSVGKVTGATGVGILATNYGADLTLETATVTGRRIGIDARNYGSGAMSITSSDAVTGMGTGTHGEGVYALNRGTNLSLQTAAVTGSDGIVARNYGSGALSITSSEAVTGTRGVGILADNHGTDLILQTAAVTGSDGSGIRVRNHGSGALSITSSEAVTGTFGEGIYANNYGTNLTLRTAAVTGGNFGIATSNLGSGTLSITSSEVVTGGLAGIFAVNRGTSLTLQTAAVTGAIAGIAIIQDGEGTLSITTDGIVTGDAGAALQLGGTTSGPTGGTITNKGGLVSNQAAAVLMSGDLNFEGDFNNNADITGGNGTAFDASAATYGFVLNQSAGTITGNVLLGSGDDRVTITGGSINGQIIGQGFGMVAVDVGEGSHFTGNGVVNVADYVVQSGTVHQLADFSTAAATTTVASGATLSFNSVIHGGGAFVSNGDLAFVVNPDTAGELVQAGMVTLNSGSTITVDISGVRSSLNESLRLIGAGSIVDNGVVVEEGGSGSLLYDFAAMINSDNVSFVTTVADLGAISPLQNPSAFGDSMAAFVNGGGDNAVVELLAGLDYGDVAGFEQIADVFSPSVSGAVSQGSRESNDGTWRLINERVVGSETALNISEPPNGLWLQGYGGITDQDAIDQVEGFDADTSGVAVGYDLNLLDWRVGVAFSAGDTDIDNDRFASDSVDIESDQFIVYGGYLQNQWFANATVSAASLDYDFKRNNMLAGEGPIESDTDGDLFGMSVGGGYKYTVSDNIVLTPQLSVRYTTLDVDDYTEDGGLDLQVEYDSIDTLASELGVSASALYGAGDWQLAPTARLAWVHEYLDENEEVTARYADQSYVQKGFDPDQDFASLGLDLQASNQYGVSISLDYRGTFGSDYTSNQGWLNLRYEF